MDKIILFLAALGAASLATSAAQASVPQARLYALDCGRIDFKDERVFSDTGEHDGEAAVMPVSCFLIQHGTEWMLSDAGLGNEIAASTDGRTVVGLHFRVPRRLASQLAVLGLKPADIGVVGLSHLHADHSGNAAMFPNATFVVSPVELAWAGATPTPDGGRADAMAAVSCARIRPAPGDLDIFGDGSVTMLATPGHTPGRRFSIDMNGVGALAGRIVRAKAQCTPVRQSRGERNDRPWIQRVAVCAQGVGLRA